MEWRIMFWFSYIIRVHTKLSVLSIHIERKYFIIHMCLESFLNLQV